MARLVLKAVIAILAIISFLIIVFIPWIIGIGQIIDYFKNKDDWWYFK